MKRLGHRYGFTAAVAACLGGLAAIGMMGSSAEALPAHARPAAQQALDVLPFPGTPDAAPGTRVVFPALAPGEIASVRALGSRSGLHTGRLSAQPSGNGSSFTPARPFVPGENVSVTATLRSAAAGTATGAPGAKRIQFSFAIARFAADTPSSPAAGPPDLTNSTNTSARGGTTRGYVTEPHWHVPIVTVYGKAPDPHQGDIFLDAQNTGHPGPYIITPHGDLVYYSPAPTSVFNTRVQSYNGKPVLTYWQGAVVGPGVGVRGQDTILNESYQKIHVVTAGNGFQKRGADLHEFTLGHEGKEGTAFVTICPPVYTNLSSVGGPPNGRAYDWVIQEIDVATNKVIWEWHALHHVPISDTYEHYIPGQTFDYFHLNSIQQLSNGNLIISARHTFAVYEISKKTGRIVWELGGKHSSFHMGPSTRFAWQHHATLYKNGTLTLFDDNNGAASRGLKLHLNFAKHQATFAHAYYHKPNGYSALSQGSTQILGDSNVFVGWGSSPHFTEFGPGGGQLFSGSFRGRVQSYRAYRFADWVGNPLAPPIAVVKKASTRGHIKVYASWNGSTRIVRWRVLAAKTKTGKFVKVGGAAWSSFATEIYLPSSVGSWVEVQALDAKGKALPHGTSAPVQAP